MAFIKFRWDWDRTATERSFQTAIKLKPNYAPAHQWYSSYLVAVERFDEAIAEAKRTEELEPLSFVASSHLGWIYYLSGDNDKAIEQCRKILELDPSSFPARRYLGLAYEAKGNVRGSDRGVSDGCEAFGQSFDAGFVGPCLRSCRQESRSGTGAQRSPAATSRSATSHHTPWPRSMPDSAISSEPFEWLEKAVEGRDIWLMNLKVDPVFAKLRTERQFTDILARIRLRPLMTRKLKSTRCFSTGTARWRTQHILACSPSKKLSTSWDSRLNMLFMKRRTRQTGIQRIKRLVYQRNGGKSLMNCGLDITANRLHR